MSNKTIKQRIALVAVSALTAGLFSVVSTPVANATSFSTVDTLILATEASATGSAIGGVVLTIGTTAIKSVGLISTSTTTGTPVANDLTDVAYTKLTTSQTGTGVVYPNASLGFGIDATAAASIVVTGGTITSSTGTGINGTSTTAVGTTAAFGVVAKAGSVVGSTMTVAAYTGANVSGTTPTNGALVGIWTFTVASASASQVYSAADSTITSQAGIAKGATPGAPTAVEDTSRIANGLVGYVYVELKDAYSSPILAASTVSLMATTSAGTIIGHATAASANSYAATSALTVIAGAAAGIYYVVVNQPVANTAGTATVNITLNGAVIATKTLNWSGDIATLAVDPTNSKSGFINGATATTSIGNVIYAAKDAAGNAVTLAVQPTVDSATGSMVGAAVYTGNTIGSGGIYQQAATGYGITTMVLAGGASLQGAGTYRLKLTNAVGTSIYSATQSVTVSNGGPNSFVASWDKATYAPGDIATLTLTVKDIYGNAVGSGTALPGLTTGLIVSTAGLTTVGGACVDASVTDSKGLLTCKFAAGNTEGAYSYSIDLNTVTAQSATIGSLKIASTSTATSNADVLKAIVSLIASINKQIAALQKALLKK